MQPLQALRNEIDQVDQQLLQLLEKRLQLVSEVGRVKHQHGLPVYVPERRQKCLLHGGRRQREWGFRRT